MKLRLPRYLTQVLLHITLGLCVSCGADKPTTAPAATAPAEPEESPDEGEEGLPRINIPTEIPEKPQGLQVSERQPVGKYLLPEKVYEGRQEPGIARFELEASLEDIIDFYAKRGYRVVRNPKGATVYPRDGNGLLQIVKSDGRRWKLMFATALKAEKDPPPGAEERLEGAGANQTAPSQ